MELTIEQALQQGISAHKEGKLQEAERLYRAILQAQPAHPDANHNLGVLAVAVNKAEVALPLFKIALENNPKIEQFWISYIDALIKENQLETARQVLADGKNQGVAAKKLADLESKLVAINPEEKSKSIKEKQTFSEKRKKLADDKRKKKVQRQGAKVRIPSKADLDKLLQHYQAGRFGDAESLAVSITQQFPEHQFSWKVLGALFGQKGRKDEALNANQKAVELEPHDTQAHNNLGNALKDVGRLEEAEASYRQAIALKSDFAEPHNNLGNALKEVGRLEEAESSYRQAITLKSDYAEPHNNLGNALKEVGRLEEAEASYRQAIALKSDYAEPHNNLGDVLKELGRLEEAKASVRQAIELKSDYAAAKHLLAALTGETSKAPPRIYVEELFDNYAFKFESALVDKLEYKIPRIITEMIIKDHYDGSLGSVLDLGCGTGLVGIEIKQFCTYLEGIDLSNLMLEQAKRKNVYDKLTYRDITDYLKTENLDFDYYISTDVFVYLGDLSEVFKLIKSRNKSGGKLVFSTENTDKEGFFLEQSGRYSHSKQYIESLCEKYNYKLCHFESQNIRKEKNAYISGDLYLLDF